MNRKHFAALLALAVLIPSLSQAQISGQVNGTGLMQQVNLVSPPVLKPDGTASGSLADREGNTKEALGHPEYTESARRGKMFTLSSSALTILATHVKAVVISQWTPIIGFYNPLGSGVNAAITGVSEYHTSGTPGGPLVWQYYCGVTWSSASSGTIYNNLLSNTTPNGSAMIAQNNTAVGTTPGIASAPLLFGVLSGPTAVAATGVELGMTTDLKGQIVVQPGCLLGLAATALGTSDVVSTRLTWEEIAQ